ncbi:MAG: hypothetical protein JO171_07315 [Paludibacterium sp.]|uniref:hypothetical protein n=1 Tax=Paludibacterium sp. TaxID=1917523 RepID=UPI0025F6213A|nr:hypothetical protein [Paludibacterium sp.]MBV8046943.1 hypothetical protein [Paludibacterium sp.]MBV8646536.1 hypothetical protein [Paludibacterium sp.]
MNTTLSVAMAAYGGSSAPLSTTEIAATTAKPATAADTATTGGQQDEHVTLSAQAVALSQGQPATATVSAATPQLQFPDATLMAQLRAAGIPSQPAFMLEVDPATHAVSVLGARPDAGRIAEIINTSA